MNATDNTRNMREMNAESSDSGWLRSTLGGYEVRELQGHELAKHFHEIIAAQNRFDESEPTSTSFNSRLP